MGGPVNIAARLRDGEIKSVESYTSSITAFTQNYRLFNEDIFHIRQFLVDGGDKTTLSPDCYGLVFVDYINQKIHSSQGYTTVGQWHIAGLEQSMSGSVLAGDEAYLDHVQMESFIGKDDARIVVKSFNPSTGERTVVETLNSVTDAKKYDFQRDIDKSFYLEVDGWEFIKYDDSPIGLIQMFKAMLADGIEFTDEDIKDWDDYVEPYLEEMETYFEEEDEV